MFNFRRFLNLLFVLVVSLFVLVDSAVAKDLSHIKFAHLSDVHVDVYAKQLKSRRLYPYSTKLLKDAVKQINSIDDLDFVVLSGDLTNTPKPANLDQFIKIVSVFKKPWYASPGNHDLSGTTPVYRKKFFETLHSANQAIPSNQFYYEVFPAKDYVFLMMNGVIMDKISAHGYFSDKELSWLDSKLSEYWNKKVVIVQHFPVVPPSKSEDHYILNQQEYMNVLDRHKNVLAVLSGHYHVTKITKFNNVMHVSTPALIEYPDAFRVITITEKPDRYVFKFDFYETNLKDLQSKSKSLTKSAELNYGKESDRNTTVEILKN